MKISFLIVLITYAIGGHSFADDPVLPVAEAIRAEATRPNSSEIGRPLPLAAHWNTGQWSDAGFTPHYQMKLIENGHHILPWFQLPDPYPYDKPCSDAYYEEPLKKAAKLGLPVTFLSTQWERYLSDAPEYFNLPAEKNPNVVGVDGTIKNKLSPFGPVQPWREIGRKWATTEQLKKIQAWYPNPPLVIFLSNNEHRRLRWHEVGESARYAASYGNSNSDDFKRKVVGDGWIERYRALQAGMREGLAAPAWKGNSRFIAYDAFGGSAFGRWGGWLKYSLYTPGRMEPWPLAWDGASPSYYVHNWDSSTDYTVMSPQVQAMNWLFMLDEAYRINPAFWFEISTWDGHEPKRKDDKRKFYSSKGQTFTPERYEGFIQFGMWLLRPRVVREFRGHLDTVENSGAYFMALLRSVDRVHSNPVLRRFWRKGKLVPNRDYEHPYQALIPKEYQKVDRWFLLGSDQDLPRPWNLETEVPVFSLALVIGTAPNREWLIYAHSPLRETENAEVSLAEYGNVGIKSSPSGSYYLVSETSRSAKRIF